jgi:hypothetical protein
MKVNLINRKDKNSLVAIIEQIIEEDYPVISSSGNYIFDWKLERYNDVYKIYLTSNKKEIIGLMSLCDYPEETRIHLNLLEIGKGNTGRFKKIDNIAGCLIAFAARISFKKGYDGMVTLEPKNKLISHYRDKYGFEDVGYMMIIKGRPANELTKKYLRYER